MLERRKHGTAKQLQSLTKLYVAREKSYRKRFAALSFEILLLCVTQFIIACCVGWMMFNGQ
jgi:hypothetical protein